MRCALCGNEKLDGKPLLRNVRRDAADDVGARRCSTGSESSATRCDRSCRALVFSPGPGRRRAAAKSPILADVGSVVSEQEPYISGPSFLGLNQPAPRKRANLSSDPHVRPSSSNLDYLLDDEEEPRRGGAGKYVLIFAGAGTGRRLRIFALEESRVRLAGPAREQTSGCRPGFRLDRHEGCPAAGGKQRERSRTGSCNIARNIDRGDASCCEPDASCCRPGPK